ncbi:MAG TPA: tetratricopeptide repeat protein [Candidatus Wunengus sp. YC61]|uniref:tetratricopeptide repeat protein n=1 Tax=Candidatus Wunengus sp. YC61 TaxID=3367698 RepID=UPI004025EBED
MKNLIMMKKIAFFSLSILCIWTLNGSYAIAGDTSLNIDINNGFKNARELYSRRENRENLKSAIDIYQNVLKQIPDNSENYNKKRAEVLIELSRCYFKMAEYHATDNNEKATWFEMGEACGREATSLDPKNVGGYYWMAQNLGEHGSISKFYFLKRKKDFEEALRKAEALDNPQKPYDYSGINRTLAAYYTPRFMWGNLNKALEYAKKMEDSPRYLSNLSVLADLYWKSDKEKAKKYAKCAINADLSQFPETQFENSFQQKTLAEKWGKLLK